MPALLETRGLSKRFGGLVANNDVSLSLAAGEIRGLIGPNGAGKTTLVNLITGIERPDAGEVRLDGRQLVGLPPYQVAAQGLARSFQVARVFGNLTVRDNLMVPYFASPRTRGTAAGAERATELLRLGALEPLAGHPPQSLSGGRRLTPHTP